MDTRAVRNGLADLVQSVAIGPRKVDEVLESAPSDTYLTGILWPRNALFRERDDETGVVAAAAGDDGATETGVPGYRLIRPCSIGITFTYRAGTAHKVSLGTTARYEPIAADDGSGAAQHHSDADSEPGSRNKRWARRQLDYSFLLNADEPQEQWRLSAFQTAGGIVNDPRVVVHIKLRKAHGLVTATVTLINNNPCDEETALDAACLFQTELVVTALSPEAIVPRHQVGVASGDDEDSKLNALLFRDIAEFAVGHGVSATWVVGAAGANAVSTTWAPRTAVSGISAHGDPVIKSALRNLSVNILAAAAAATPNGRAPFCTALRAFCKTYQDWIGTHVEARLSEFSGPLREAAETNFSRCTTTLKRMQAGVALLASNDHAWRAFELASQAMDDQAQYKSKKERAGPLVWRPFQLAFVLLVVPSIVHETDDNRKVMDLLWFPTGGGKTEAYLAITAFTIFFKRLTSQGRRDAGGVDVLMRYTLRLLTVQQFQRAAALVHACDLLRSQSEGELGKARITVGLYVGSETTPNKIEQAEARIAEEVAGGHPHSTPRQLLECPICGEGLPPSSYRAQPLAKRLKITCPNASCDSRGRDLPVEVIDDTIYDSPPSLLIGTVDKFAQLPRRADLQELFGLTSSDRPSLVIQDELHLISGPLGSMTGLYEAAIDVLCSKDGVPPKIIGSSATIGRAASQVRALFDRDVLLFPPPAIDAGNSFFAFRDSSEPERLYLGLCSAGRSPKFALQAVLGSALQAAQTMSAVPGVTAGLLDPYWTCVAYFNSLRELGGAIVMMLDDVPRTVAFTAGLLGSPPRVLTGVPKELSSRIASNEIPAALKSLNAHLGGDPFDESPVDAVLASNMISVGVDVPRLGLMVVNGQPKTTAEYIQATSRVGRKEPGLVLTLYNFGRPRDVSHFEHFRSYHSALYRNVEATSVTPWAPRARDKGLHAVFVSLVRHLLPHMLDDENAVDFDVASGQVQAFVDYLAKRASASTDGREEAETREQLAAIVNEWARRARSARSAGHRLLYWEKRAPFGRTAPHLMRDAERMKGSDARSWATPNSLREIEPSTAFVLRRTFRDRQKREGADE